MSYVLYGAPGSGSGIIEAACAELGAACEVRDLDARNDEHRGDAFAAINPQRKMPVLIIGEEIITESVAILLTLDERHPEGRLLPPVGSAERAQALRWMLFMATEMYPLVEVIDYPERFSAADPENARKQADAILRERWKILEANVAGAPYALTGGFCATDLYITKFAVWLEEGWRQEELPRVQRICSATRARPRLEGVWARHIR